VALDEHGKPVEVPQIIPETEDQKRRYAKAQIRREGRLRTRDELSKASGWGLSHIAASRGIPAPVMT